jgi:uncharacterized membrane protein YjfL (UPF0719 family)
MSINVIIFGIIEIGFSLLTGLLIFFLSFKVFTILTRNIDELNELKKNNTAVAILVASFVFGIMLLAKQVIDPSMENMKILITGGDEITTNIVLFSVLRILLVYVIASVFAFIVLWLSMKLFMLLTTQIDEMAEIKNNNTAISIIIAVLIISVTLILSQSLKTIFEGFIPSARLSPNEPLFNTDHILQGLIELGISFFAVIFIFFIGFKIFDLLTRKIDEVEELKSNNIAISVLISSFIFSVMILIRSSIEPSIDTLETLIAKNASIGNILLSGLYIIIFFVGAAIIAFIILWLAMKAFMLFTTTIDEMAQIKNNNLAVAIIIAILLISAALLLTHGLNLLFDGLKIIPGEVESGGSATTPLL